MGSTRAPVTLAAERAVRFLRSRHAPVGSAELARAVLRTRVRDEDVARRVLETAFAGDPRLSFDDGTWRARLVPLRGSQAAEPRRRGAPAEPPRVLLLVRGGRLARGEGLTLLEIAAVRIEGGAVVAACGGEVSRRPAGGDLRRATREILTGAVPVVHDPPGAIAALELWLDEPLDSPVSLRRLGQDRLGLPASHDLEALAARLHLPWRDSDDPLDLVETVDAVLSALRRPGEDLDALRTASRRGSPPPDWSRFAFDREFLREIPHVAGTYRFYDAAGKLLYVGKSRDLHARVGSYFREVRSRPSRVQGLLDALHRIELEPVGSDLEAVLREAAAIRRRRPARNVQRKLHPRGGAEGRLRSILILEPAEAPWVLRAWLIREGHLLDSVPLGPKGGGLRRIERVLRDEFFDPRSGPRSGASRPIDVEIVARWLAENRDKAVAFDPTHLKTAEDVVQRLRWFLDAGALQDPEGSPILPR
jgi:hypothetical protein